MQASKTTVVYNSEIERVDAFKYLGAMFSEDGRIETEFDSRISAARGLYGVIKQKFLGKREISKWTKLAVYKPVHNPTAIYGCVS